MIKSKVISFENVTKLYRLYKDKPRTIKEIFTKSVVSSYTERKVLDNVSFDIYEGEIVGIIGKNGAGKSTILKIISKILYQNSGKVVINGTISSLLELGAGFDENFTGRENIYFNSSIFGISKKDVDLIIDDIIEFADIGEYIDLPVRTYSSGMYIRLAFAVAINVKADILLFDEILAVGDEEFKRKCINKIIDLNSKGKTILFVSHDMRIVEKICTRVFYIENGKIVMSGKPNDVICKYLGGSEIL